MRVQLAKCRDAPFEFEFDFDLTAGESRYHEFARLPRPHAGGRLTTGGGGKYVATGNVGANVQAVCVRCLAVFQTRLERPYQVVFVPSATIAGADDVEEVGQPWQATRRSAAVL